MRILSVAQGGRCILQGYYEEDRRAPSLPDSRDRAGSDGYI